MHRWRVYLKEPKLVRCLVRSDDEGLDIADVGISASDGKCYTAKARCVSRKKKKAAATGTQEPQTHINLSPSAGRRVPERGGHCRQPCGPTHNGGVSLE